MPILQAAWFVALSFTLCGVRCSQLELRMVMADPLVSIQDGVAKLHEQLARAAG